MLSFDGLKGFGYARGIFLLQHGTVAQDTPGFLPLEDLVYCGRCDCDRHQQLCK